MAIYSINRVVRTVTLHKDDGCTRSRRIARRLPCVCGMAGKLGNHEWCCETHVTVTKIAARVGAGRHWAMLLCTECFG